MEPLLSPEESTKIHEVRDLFIEAINQTEAPAWNSIRPGQGICVANLEGRTAARIAFTRKSNTGYPSKPGYTLVMTGNAVWIPWSAEDGQPSATIFTTKRDLTTGELRKGLTMVAMAHARNIEFSPNAPRKMYNVQYGNKVEEDGVVAVTLRN